MARRRLYIAGQRPTIQWKKNVGRKKRTIDEAVLIATQWGVVIPDYVEFILDDAGVLQGNLNELYAGGQMETAKCPEVQEHKDGYVYWMDHVPAKSKTGKIPIRINPDVLTSDEAIVAVFQHEVFELSAIHEVCMGSPRQRMSATDYYSQIRTHNYGNYHCQAWDLSDELVLRMRAAKNDKSS